ncbi:MAG: hypothetical protein WBW99_14355, partial [Pseudolabrys sp.]
CQSFVGGCRADNGGDDLMQVGEPLNGIGEGLLVDLRVFCPEPVTKLALILPNEKRMRAKIAQLIAYL